MMTTTTCATFHSIERAKERIGLNSRNAEKMITQAFLRGKTAEEFTSWERSYLEKEAYGECVAMAYSGFCYIFNSVGACVTMYSLPSWWEKKKHFDGKTRIRNAKKYSKYYN